MTRNLKALALAFGALLVLCASLAPAAQAETGALTASKYPTLLTAQRLKAGPVFTVPPGNRAVSCNTDALDGTIEKATDPVTFTPTYAGCFSNGLPATITMNGCDYTLAFTVPGSTGDPAGTGKLTLQVDCPTGKQIEIHIYENEVKHSENKPLCTYDIGPQFFVAAGTYHNRPGPPKDVELTLDANLAAKSTLGTKLLCGAAAEAAFAMSLKGEYTLRGYEDNLGVEGAQLDLDVG